MIKSNRRIRIKLVRQAVASMPPESLERMVSISYMYNYTEFDIHDDLRVSWPKLLRAKKNIKEILKQAGIC